ncbi:uncharacterized protein LOC116419492 [Sarcophilus harrisii]|uniref:uncharacterized protein LOC116419492 n=1 Tax=Sarcophilus harrisii TaxID=9305 RepID=UPI001301F2EA|nr:uncharacterized protein LOC116419492 [Sarcophilus harrisii]
MKSHESNVNSMLGQYYFLLLCPVLTVNINSQSGKMPSKNYIILNRILQVLYWQLINLFILHDIVIEFCCLIIIDDKTFVLFLDHPEKNPNVKPSQCGLPMKDPSTSQESEKVVKPKLKLDHPGKNRNVKPSQCGLPMKDPSTSQESEKVVKSKQKLEVMGKVDLSAAENTDDGSNWDSTSTSETHKTHRSSKNLNLQRSDVGKSLLRTLNKLGSTRAAAGSGPEVENPGPQKQCEPLLEKEAQTHHPGKNRNVKPSQCGLPMKDPSTSQESEKVVKTKRKLAFMEKVDLPAAENTDDGSNWDSTSTSEIHKSHRSSKILNLQRSDVGKSLLRTLNKLGSTRVAAGSGPEVENPGPQKQCEPPLEKEAQKRKKDIGLIL